MAMPTNYVKATVITGRNIDSAWANVLWYELASAPAGDALTFAESAADAIQNAVRDDWVELLSNVAYFFGVVAAVNLAGNVYTGNTIYAGTNGTNDADVMPNFVSGIVRKRTSTPGKSGRGRWYISGIAESLQEGSRLTGAGLGLLGALCEHLNETLVVSGINLAPRHHSQKNDSLVPIVNVQPLFALGTQRRRMFRGVGGNY